MRVETGDRVGIGGFIITGSAPEACAPPGHWTFVDTLRYPDVLADPVLELHGSVRIIFATITNNNWRDTQEAADPGHRPSADQ